ncbi:MAG: hypothetical protein ABIJ45_10810 [Candidatus Zixiibacteriota bacterium]
MLKKIAILTALLLLAVAVTSAFADTEDEIIAKYLKKTEKKHANKIGFISTNFSYGKLSNDIGYNSFSFSASSDLTELNGSVHPHERIYRSKELGLSLGMMVSPKAALSFGFDYWLNMNTKVTIDQTTTIGTLDIPELYVDDASLNVYGIKAGFDYYFLDHPDNEGILNKLALKLGGGTGYYFASWDVWNETSDQAEPLKANSFALWVNGGAEYPIGFAGLIVGADVSYFFLNFSDVTSYNQETGDLTMAYLTGGDKVELNFSGPRAKIMLKKYLLW